MPVNYHWNNTEKNIVVFTFTDPWLIQEYAECEYQVREAFKETDQVIDAILNFEDASTLPQNALSYFVSSLRKGEGMAQEGVSVVYGANTFIHMIGHTLTKIVRNADLYFVSTLEEAETVIADIKSTRTPTQTDNR